MSLEEWQIALRREYGREQAFTLKNVGAEPIFSEYLVTNPKSGGTYRVAIRGNRAGTNYCSCPDFAVNTLGTCKHVEWLLGKLARKRGGKRAFREGFHPPYSEVYLHYGVRREVRFRPGTECPDGLYRLAERFFDTEGALREEAASTFERFVREAAKIPHDVRTYDDALDFVAQLRDVEMRRRKIEDRFPESALATCLDALVKAKLHPYQRVGALFAAKAGRCLIADDMGLGKTIQAIAAVEILAHTMGVQRVLVVGPAAVKYQWKQEIERFTDRSAVIVEGLLAKRRELYKAESFYKIINYDVVHRDLDLINVWEPDVVIVDEAQRIKNWETRRAKVVKQIASDYAIVLTGTPLENRLEELHSIVEFVDRFHLGPLFRFLAEHQCVDSHGRVIGYQNLDRIGMSLASVMIRRRKQEVLHELPERTDKHFFVDMTPEQMRHHEENRDLVAKVVAKWRRWGFLSDKDQRRLMIALQNMRMSCNSTYLLDKETDHSTKMDECRLLLDDVLEFPDHKAVVFSQWIRTHELLIRRLAAESRPYAFYHGSLDGQDRRQVIDRFKNDSECCVLLCTDSGGVGLNLQVASVVVNMDQPWNPAVLEQRIGRVHRLGQSRNVQVYHFVSRGTIEQGMLGVLKFKTSVFAGVLDGGESEVFLGGSKMKKFMETVEKVSAGIPAEIPLQEEAVDAFEPAAASSGPEESAERVAVSQTSGTPSVAEQTWNDALAAGLDFLGKLGAVLRPERDAEPALPVLASLVAQNEKTGLPELRIPLPDPEAARKLAAALSGLGEMLRKLTGPA